MRSSGRGLLVGVAVSVVVLAGALPSGAQTPAPTPSPTPSEPAPTPSPTPSPTPTEPPEPVDVTITAGRRVIVVGQGVGISGTVNPVVPGARVVLRRQDGSRIKDVAVSNSGAYKTSFSPRRNVTLHAAYSGSSSREIKIQVKPKLRASLRSVALFGNAPVSGTLRPAHPDGSVTVSLRRNGKVVASKKAGLRGKGFNFKTKLKVNKPGTYRAYVRFNDSDHLAARAKTNSATTTSPSLSLGSKAPAVKRLERRLRKLGYHIEGVDQWFDGRTADAVLAFNKVQRRARVSSVSASTWAALGSPIRPKPRSGGNDFHIEIDQTRQVLFTVNKGKVTGILHTSTGAGGATRDGSWVVHRKLAGTSGGGLYYPSYFDGLRAIHGWPEVPTFPASHGCSRVPMWAAQWIFGKVPIGTRVIVYH